MPYSKSSIDVQVPIRKVWEFVHSMDNWAPLIPGYISHERLNKKESCWTFFGDIGFIRKKVSLKVTVTDWEEPKKILFKLKEADDKFCGCGYFEAEELEKRKTNMKGYIEIKAKGAKGPVKNAVLMTVLPNLVKELTESIAKTIQETEIKGVKS